MTLHIHELRRNEVDALPSPHQLPAQQTSHMNGWCTPERYTAQLSLLVKRRWGWTVWTLRGEKGSGREREKRRAKGLEGTRCHMEETKDNAQGKEREGRGGAGQDDKK